MMRNTQTPNKPYMLFTFASIFTGMLIFVVVFFNHGEIGFLRMIGAVFGISSLFFFIPPFIALKKFGGVDENKTFLETTQVVSSGIYGIIRHPQYFGYILMVLCFMLLSQNWMAVGFGAVAIFSFYLHIIQEEKYCLATFGEAYQHYMAEVPRINLFLGIIRKIRKKQTWFG